MEVTTIRLPVWMLKAIEELVALGIFPSKSEFVREAIRQLLTRYARELKRNGFALHYLSEVI